MTNQQRARLRPRRNRNRLAEKIDKSLAARADAHFASAQPDEIVQEARQLAEARELVPAGEWSRPPRHGGGGYNHGAGGRPKGTGRPQSKRSVLTTRLAEEILESGRSPLEIMWSNAVFFDREAERLTEEYENLDEGDKRRQELFERIGICRRASELCAADAAPYCYPRVSAITIERGGNEGRLIVHVTGLDALV